MKNKLIFPLIFVGFGVACGGDDGVRAGSQQSYEVVQEGSAAGVTSTIQGPGETLPALTGTNADTTTAFSIDPNVASAAPAAQTAGTLAGTMPSYPPPMTSATTRPPVNYTPPSQPVTRMPSSQPVRTQPAPAPQPQPAEQEPAEPQPPATDTAVTQPPAATAPTKTAPPAQAAPQPQPKPQQQEEAEPEQEEEEAEEPPPPTTTDTRGQ